MRSLPFIMIAQIGGVWAATLPPKLEDRQFYVPCPDSFYSEPQCCEQNLILQDVDCWNVWPPPLDVSDYLRICAEGGKIPRCCIEPNPWSALLCKNPPGLPPGPWD
ncbi:hypothetical protein GGR51DRAFT_520582 [Nemania sp. FL0031]|nr:hypothetical protein GGR51DRAFT_520582 [Nemania sp. FL0031]